MSLPPTSFKCSYHPILGTTLCLSIGFLVTCQTHVCRNLFILFMWIEAFQNKITQVISSSLSQKTSSVILSDPCRWVLLVVQQIQEELASFGTSLIGCRPLRGSTRPCRLAKKGKFSVSGYPIWYPLDNPGGLHCKHCCLHHYTPSTTCHYALGAAFSPQIRELMRQKKWCSVTRRKLTKKVSIKIRVPFPKKGPWQLWHCDIADLCDSGFYPHVKSYSIR